MKKTITRILAIALTIILAVGSLTACFDTEVKLSTDPYEGDVIYIGNTAGVTGAMSEYGIPFNYGIRAALKVYNDKGGFNGKKVELKSYDDGSEAGKSVTLMEQLIHQDNVFAIVGNFYAPCVEANLQTLKENAVPMVYAAAGNNILFNENATSDADRAIFPVQPLNYTEGRSLIIRAFAPAVDAEGNLTGGIGATKVGVIANAVETSKAMLQGIKDEAKASLTAEQRNKIVYQEVATEDYSGAINALMNAGCDLVIVTVTGPSWITVLSQMADKDCKWSVMTTYNNSNVKLLNNTEKGDSKVMSTTIAKALANMKIYAQGWVNIVETEVFTNPEACYQYKGSLLGLYASIGQAPNGYVIGFTEEYWSVAEALYAYGIESGKSTSDAFSMTYDSYALAGYIAGDLFCQALTRLQESGKELTRANLVEILETGEFKICMGDTISYQNGKRVGVQAFSLLYFFASGDTAASTSLTSGTSTLEELQALLK